MRFENSGNSINKSPLEPDEVITLRAELRTPENTAELINLQAKSAQGNLNFDLDNLEPTKPIPICSESFSALYNPSQPTVVIDPQSSYTGVELVGMAAQRYDIPLNIIYTSFASGSTIFTEQRGDKSGSAAVSAGYIVDANGQVHYGEFPTIIDAQLIETNTSCTVAQAEALGIPSSQSSIESRLLGDKDVLEALTQGTGLNIPKRLAYEELSDPIISSNVVIKPSKQAQGIGVFIADNNTTPEHAQKVYSFLRDSGYAPIIESRVHCIPATDPETGDVLDWNVRALVFNGQPIGTYVRADYVGKPVNRCNGATAIHFDDFGNYFADTEIASRVMLLLRDGIATAARNFPSGYLGVDLTITPDFKDYLFEVNTGNVGGLQTIANLASTPEEALESPKRMAQVYLAMTTTLNTREPNNRGNAYYPTPDFDDLAFAAHRIDKDDLLAAIPIESLPLYDSRFGYGRMLALEAHRDKSLIKGAFSNMTKADELLRQDNPLDGYRLSRLMMNVHTDMSEMSEKIELIASLYPNDTKWLKHQAAAAAAKFDIAGLRDTYQKILLSKNPDSHIDIATFIAIMLHKNRMIMRELSLDDDPFLYDITCTAIAMCCEDADNSVSDYIARLRGEAPKKLEVSLAKLDFLLAIGDKRYNDATLLLESCDDDFYYSDFVFNTIMQEMRANITSTPDGLLFYANYAFSVDTYGDTLLLLNDALQDLDDAETQHVIQGLEAMEMGELSIEETTRVVDLIKTHQLNTIPEDASETDVPELDIVHYSSIDIFIYLIDAIIKNQNVYIKPYIRALRKDPRLENDANTLESLFIDLDLAIR